VGALADERYLSLTTFRRDGSAASAPVWVVSDDGERLLVWTSPQTWKVRRIRRDPHVRVAPCDARGRVRGEAVEGTARLVDEVELAERLIREKYGWQKVALDAYAAVSRTLRRRTKPAAVCIEIRTS
jgi:uncharacterized protein